MRKQTRTNHGPQRGTKGSFAAGTWLGLLLVLAVWLVSSPAAQAYSTYSGCKACHGDFDSTTSPRGIWSSDKHTVHLQKVSSNCAACHDGSPDGDNENMVKCAGCHGHDYTGADVGIERDAAVGLRKHHEATGTAGICLSCHNGSQAPLDPATSKPEDTPTSNSATYSIDPCNGDGSEDWDGDVGLGLDNDGDDVYDGNDSDCQVDCEPEVTLTNTTVDQTEEIVACTSITIGPNVQIVRGTFRAGANVVFIGTVEAQEMSVTIDDTLLPRP